MKDMNMSKTLDIETMIRLKSEGWSARRIGREYGWDGHKVSKLAKQHGLTFAVTKDNARMAQFLTMTNPVIAYFLGYIWADGFVSRGGNVKRCNSIGIQLRRDDGEHLHGLIKDCMRVSAKVSHRVYKDGSNRRPQLAMHLSDTVFTRWLVDCLDYGDKSRATPNKMLSHIPSNLHAAFWLGYFDGDGTIELRRKQVQIASSYDQDWKAMKELCMRLKIQTWHVRRYISKKGHRSSAFIINSKEYSITFMRYIYTHRDIALPRKLAKFDWILAKEEEYKEHRRIRNERIHFITTNPHMKQHELAVKLGTSVRYIKGLRRSLRKGAREDIEDIANDRAIPCDFSNGQDPIFENGVTGEMRIKIDSPPALG